MTPTHDLIGPDHGRTTAKTTVVNVKSGEPFDVYIGRAVPRKRLKASIWANPYRVGRDGTRDEVIRRYRDYLMSRPDLLARLPELYGKRLGCWCSPEKCHGDLLARLVEEPRITEAILEQLKAPR